MSDREDRTMIMKAIILAAGVGTRMGGVGEFTPKCLIKVNGNSILHQQVEIMRRKGIQDITVVIGAKGNCWSQNSYDEICDERIKVVLNFENIAKKRMFSLAVGLIDIDCGPLLIVDGDLAFNSEILDAMIVAEGDIVLLARDSKDIHDSSKKIEVDGKRIIRMGQKVFRYPWKINVGFIKVAKSIFEEFKNDVSNPQYLERSLSDFIDGICKKNNICVVSKNKGWVNINGPEDVMSAKALALGTMQTEDRLSSESEALRHQC